ncbi:MAG TPA: hypothetical protein VHU19_18155 [Pyrinomonadaceae bacterium]|nr:hypothetical protein [Pyrinomonadaceae bacterium]
MVNRGWILRNEIIWHKPNCMPSSVTAVPMFDLALTYSPLSQGNNLTVFATTNFRGRRTPFGIKRQDRRAHIYIIGKTGAGKSTLLETMVWQDIRQGSGMALLDPTTRPSLL